ncbi:MAG TPA: MoxR family ATPase, partial [Planctomycetota bacterium]|nr:MoxR family ATPase [Planctomycetota bacterium]
ARHTLERPFMVLATQNPIEQEGTYRLPEAQLDRFLLKIIVDYPSHDDERGIIERTTGTLRGTVSPVIDREEILALQRIVRALRVSNHIVEYATRIVRASRPGEEGAASWVDDLVAWGAGPRATQALVLAAKARTLMSGRFAVTRAAVRDVARPVLRHRVLPNFRAEAEGLGADDIVGRLVDEAPFFEPREGFDDVTRAILGI